MQSLQILFHTVRLVILEFTLRACLQAEELISSGYAEVFGTATQEYWETMSRVAAPPPHEDSVGLCLFGDEAEIYKDNQYMAAQWSSEQSPFWTDVKKSRFLICLLPVHRYAMDGQINVTIQEAMKHICASLNAWQNHAIGGLHARFVSLKGDWKWLVQCLNLKRKPTKDDFCFLCNCTKSLAMPATDLSENAEWRRSVPTCPWPASSPPAIVELGNFSMATVGLDVLHIWNLGTGRDLTSSALLILLRTGAFEGRNAAGLHFLIACLSMQFSRCPCMRVPAARLKPG